MQEKLLCKRFKELRGHVLCERGICSITISDGLPKTWGSWNAHMHSSIVLNVTVEEEVPQVQVLK